jgi:hypothetical protein
LISFAMVERSRFSSEAISPNESCSRRPLAIVNLSSKDKNFAMSAPFYAAINKKINKKGTRMKLAPKNVCKGKTILFLYIDL